MEYILILKHLKSLLRNYVKGRKLFLEKKETVVPWMIFLV